MMFPYPSAEGLHVGNVFAFTGADIYGRFRRLRGRYDDGRFRVEELADVAKGYTVLHALAYTLLHLAVDVLQ